MATLAELYTRIILQTDRDDLGASGALEQAKVDAVADAIEEHAGELFWFNRASGSVSTVAGAASVALPSGMRLPLQVSYGGCDLARTSLEAIQQRSDSGRPARWAAHEGAIQLWPVPDAAYSLDVFGIAQIGVPANPDDANAWTSEALALTIATAREILMRDYLIDQDGEAAALRAKGAALRRLRRETRRRAGVALVTDITGSAPSYDIAADR